MNSTKSGISSGKLAAVAVIAAMLAIGACASGTILKWNQVDADAMLKGDAGRNSFNVIRFETFGPVASRSSAIPSTGDGIEVVTDGGAHIVNLGKRTLEGVIADHAMVTRSKQYSGGSSLLVREIVRGGTIVGYTAGDLNIDLSIWDITSSAGSESKIVLKPVFTDRRQQIDGGMHPDRTFTGD